MQPASMLLLLLHKDNDEDHIPKYDLATQTLMQEKKQPLGTCM